METPKEIKEILSIEDNRGYKRTRRNVLVHQLVWEEHHGKIPKGMVIHHINKNKRDNRIINLKCVTHKKHAKLHSSNNIFN